MNFDPAAAHDHVAALAKKHRVTVHWKPQPIGEAHVGTRQIWTSPITTAWSYLEALHELGHVVDRDAKRTAKSNIALCCEGAAWEWALYHADPEVLPKLTKSLRNRIADAWATYLPGKL